MTLTDAGALVALIDAGEPDHDCCRNALERLELPLVMTWPTFTEAIYLLGLAAGWAAQAVLWRMVQRDVSTLADLDRERMLRCVQLMERYRDHAMDSLTPRWSRSPKHATSARSLPSTTISAPTA